MVKYNMNHDQEVKVREPIQEPQESPRLCSVCNQARAINNVYLASGMVMNKCVSCEKLLALVGIRTGIDEIVEELRKLNGDEY